MNFLLEQVKYLCWQTAPHPDGEPLEPTMRLPTGKSKARHHVGPSLPNTARQCHNYGFSSNGDVSLEPYPTR